MNKVFGVVELAEQILLDLPLRNLLVSAPRVCRRWKALMDNSTAIQCALFLLPLPGPVRDVALACDEENMLHSYLVVTDTEVAPQLLLNPFFAEWHAQKPRRPWCTELIFNPSEGEDDEPAEWRRAAALRPEASWRAMLICQPAIKTANCPYLGGTEDVYHHTKFTSAVRHDRMLHVVNATGVRIEDMPIFSDDHDELPEEIVSMRTENFDDSKAVARHAQHNRLQAAKHDVQRGCQVPPGFHVFEEYLYEVYDASTRTFASAEEVVLDTTSRLRATWND